MDAEDLLGAEPAPLLSSLAHALAGPLIQVRSGLASGAGEGMAADDTSGIARAFVVLDGLTRLAAAERDVLPARVSLDDALRRALRRVRARVDPPQVQAAALTDVLADEDHVELMLAELLANVALHAGPEARARVATTEPARPGTVVLVVEDDGPGLPPGVDPRAPLAFAVRTDGSAGCGLAVVAALARANRGWLVLTTRAGGPGVRAELHLPAATD